MLQDTRHQEPQDCSDGFANAVTFRVAAWAGWRAGEAGAPTAGVPAAPAASVPSILRRRIGALGQHALRDAWAMGCAGDARLVFASRHGEFGRTLSLMEDMARGEGVSPADFTLSVHHALAGLLSIAAENRAGHVAVASGDESVFYGLLEAAAGIHEAPGVRQLVVCYDEGLAAPFDVFNEGDGTAATLVLTLGDAEGERMTLSSRARRDSDAVSSSAIGALRDFLAGDAPASVICGSRLAWRIARGGP